MLAPSHIVLLGLVILLALVVFGPKRLPELGQGVGRAIQEFKHASSQAAHEFNTTSAELKSAVAFDAATPEMAPATPVANGAVPVATPSSSEQGQSN